MKIGEKCGFINAKGEIVIDPQFDGALLFSDNGLAYVSVGDQCGFINTSGEYVIPLQSTWTAQHFAGGGIFQRVNVE